MLGRFGMELLRRVANGFAADSDTSHSEKILDISVAEVESVVQPDCVTDDIWWEPVSFICIHWQILR
jgi:hypothetical protein